MSVKGFESDKWAVSKFFLRRKIQKGISLFFFSNTVIFVWCPEQWQLSWEQGECQPKIINKHSKNSRMAEWKYSKKLRAYWRCSIAKLSESANSSIASSPEFLSEITHVLLVLSYFLFSFKYMLPKQYHQTPLKTIPAFSELQ